MCYIAGGAYAEYTAAPALHAFKVPDGLSDEVAAAAYMQGLAATTLVCEAFEAVPGRWALVHAAAGGVGLWLCQLLRLQGVNVVATASTEEKRQIATALQGHGPLPGLTGPEPLQDAGQWQGFPDTPGLFDTELDLNGPLVDYFFFGHPFPQN